MAKDVKDTVEASTTDSAKETVVTEAKADGVTTETDQDLSFDPLEEKPIPYKVFKEKNAKLRDTERELKALKGTVERQVQDELMRRESQLRREMEARYAPQAKQEDDFQYVAPELSEIKALREELGSVKRELSEVSTSTQRKEIQETIEALKHEYPRLEMEHVIAVKKLRPEMSWEQVAEYSHNKFHSHVDSQWKALVESKKQAATKKVVGPEGLRNLKPGERPKNWQEAAKMTKQFLGD